MTDGYKIKKVLVWKGNIPDMQGPCPTGYHVPSKDELDTLVSIGNSLGAWNNNNNAKIYLKMPIPGFINCTDGTVSNRGTGGAYISSTFYSTYVCYSFLVGNGKVTSVTSGSNGYNIRPFKDTPVVPDSNWTVLYQGTGDSGIYHNTTLGVISLSSNGTKWITIADKNLGATTVYNDGDTLTESNCGKYYQRGNNYGFPFNGATSTTSTRVDASTYGPGNYYNSSTFFITSDSSIFWDSSLNNNLRGGVTGPLKEYQVYTDEKPYEGNELCFTANTANSTVQLTKTGSPTSVTLETTRDGKTWSTYTIGDTITLTNVGDKVYMRNTSTSTTGFSGPGYNDYYKFVMTGSIAASGDINYLLNKNSTTTLSGNYIYCRLFYQCASLTSTPRLPATTLSYGCYQNMFMGCSNLETLPSLPAITLTETCYSQMFANCSKIKLSTSKTGAYQTSYRIPTTGTGSTASSALFNMFSNTGGTYTGGVYINTTYYTSNTVV